MDNVEDEVVPFQREFRHMQSIITSHEASLEDMDNRQRRNNVWAGGIPERTEGKNLVAFMETWLLNTFGRFRAQVVGGPGLEPADLYYCG